MRKCDLLSQWFLNAIFSYSYVLILRALCVPVRQIIFKIQMALHKIAKTLHDIFIHFITVHGM